jgi:hypothetical protein
LIKRDGHPMDIEDLKTVATLLVDRCGIMCGIMWMIYDVIYVVIYDVIYVVIYDVIYVVIYDVIYVVIYDDCLF